jgi:uncharacterized protein YciI
MYFIVFATDKPGMDEVRANVRPSHRLYLRNHNHPIRLLQGGPTLDDAGERMNGTLLVIEAESPQQVRAFVADDPYSEAGLFESLEVRPWAWGLGKPEE